MIKINLQATTKSLDVSNIGGLDLTVIKYKALILVIVLLYVPDFVIYPAFEQELEEINQVITQKNSELRRVNGKLSKGQDVEKQINELKLQEENLKKKLLAVKQAINEKRNPSALLLYLAKNTPENLWINDLSLSGDLMKIKGEALDYVSIGNFVNNLRSSVFIKEANIVGTSSAVREADKKRVESFEVSFQIARFDQ
jgi:Tfp pilus assembly protein PilN